MITSIACPLPATLGVGHMEITNTIDPTTLPMLHELAERGKRQLEEEIGDWVGSPDLRIEWRYYGSPAREGPLNLEIQDPLIPILFAASFRLEDFDDPERLRYKVLRTWAMYLKERSHRQLDRLDQLVKSIDGD